MAQKSTSCAISTEQAGSDNEGRRRTGAVPGCPTAPSLKAAKKRTIGMAVQAPPPVERLLYVRFLWSRTSGWSHCHVGRPSSQKVLHPDLRSSC